MYNPTLEKVRIQANSRGFSFLPMELTEIPLALANIIGEQVAYKGLFVVWPNQSLDSLDSVKLQGLKNFKEFNDDRIRIETAYLDERRKAGVTVEDSPKLSQWKQWSKELGILLSSNNVIEPVRSFLDNDVKKELMPTSEVSAPVEQFEEPAEDSSEDIEEAPAKRRGRPPKAVENVSL